MSAPGAYKEWGAGRSPELRTQKTKGQFFTPSEVVDFMFKVAGAGPGWSVIDPACGDGVFLERATAGGCAPVWGIDSDPDAVRQCRTRLGSAAVVLEQNGLVPLAAPGTPAAGFDLVIGNPPFNTLRHSESAPHVLAEFVLGRHATRRVRARQALEVLFLERFVQLCRPGGVVAIIVPDGILANSRLRYVREFIVSATSVRAVISLPRSTFASAATSAKTSVLVLEKGPAMSSDSALLASVGGFDDFPAVVDLLRGEGEPRRAGPEGGGRGMRTVP